MSLSIVQQKIQDFMTAAGQKFPTKPTVPDDNIQSLRLTLIEEELEELENAWNEKNLVEIADALADLVYVVVGAAVACGIELGAVFEEVHSSNMTKFIDGYRRDDGKWIKGPSYTPAKIGPIIEAQLAN